MENSHFGWTDLRGAGQVENSKGTFRGTPARDVGETSRETPRMRTLSDAKMSLASARPIKAIDNKIVRIETSGSTKRAPSGFTLTCLRPALIGPTCITI